MIKYQLRCNKEHEFEGWFADSASCEEQLAAGAVACPVCGSLQVSKAIMAPRIGKGIGKSVGKSANEGDGKSVAVSPGQQAAELKQALRSLRKQVEDNCDYVGEQFAEEARKIHYGETEARGIYGESTDKEASDLADEGIEVSRIPWIPREDA